MQNNFSILLDNAIKRCDGMYVQDYQIRHLFHFIYPFTTENINGYINYFNLENKSLLTVGSSCDQIFNAILKNCKDITLLDINPYARFYYFLKMSAILCLDLNEFLYFFRYQDFPKVFKKNRFVFDKSLYDKLYSTLRILDYESFLFWDELFNNFTNIDIRQHLFSLDEDNTLILRSANCYLNSEDAFYKLKEKLKSILPTFICDDVYSFSTNRKFDNIWLSNIANYENLNKNKDMLDLMVNYLNDNGKILFSYLYQTTINSKYSSEYAEIYDLESVYKIFDNYDLELLSFLGIKGLKFKDDDIKDSILLYTKH